MTGSSWVVFDKVRKVQGPQVCSMGRALAQHAQRPGLNPQHPPHKPFKVILTHITRLQLQEAMPFKTKITKRGKEVLNWFLHSHYRPSRTSVPCILVSIWHGQSF